MATPNGQDDQNRAPGWTQVSTEVRKNMLFKQKIVAQKILKKSAINICEI